MNKKCNKCGVDLVIGENCTQNGIDRSQYICKDCRSKYDQKNRDHRREYEQKYRKENREHMREYERQYNHKIGKCQPMSENKSCAQYLGVVIAEKVLSKVFKNVQTMPYGHKGYDFVCGKGFKVDVKSSCIRKYEKKSDSWAFNITKNKTPNYFLCLAFDTREDLNPLYMWLIPGDKVNHLSTTGISITTLKKWDEYKLDIDKVISCCNVIKDSKL